MPRQPRLYPTASGGYALLAVTVVLLLLWASTASFIWYMHRQIAWAGGRYRDTAALHLAQSAIRRALAILEATAPDGSPGRLWRPQGYTELTLNELEEGTSSYWIEEGPGGVLAITVEGRVREARRRLQVLAYPAAPALLIALYGRSNIQLDSPSITTFAAQARRSIPRAKWAHMGVGRQLRFVGLGSGNIDLRAIQGAQAGEAGPANKAAPAPVGHDEIVMLMPRDASFTLGHAEHVTSVDHLRVAGIRLARDVPRVPRLPSTPRMDSRYYRNLARQNVGNAELNRLAGLTTSNPQLARKRHSFYESAEMADLLRYAMVDRNPLVMSGLVYVEGVLDFPSGIRVRILSGGLIAEEAVYVGKHAELSATQDPTQPRLPGLIAAGGGGIVIGENASLRVEGIVIAERAIDLGRGSRLEVVGAIHGGDPSLSLWNSGAEVIIHYDPQILGTVGLVTSSDEPIIAWLLEWKDLGR